jgi:hypothetical protein
LNFNSDINIEIKANTKINDSFNLRDRSLMNNGKSLNPNRKDQSSKSSSKNIINYSNHNILTKHSNGRNKSNERVKTIFTIMSEEIFDNVKNYNNNINDKSKKEKLNTYEMMINENLLEKVAEKMSKGSKQISNNFMTRNIQDSKLREFKKKMHYTTNSEHVLSITRPQSALSSEKPNSILSGNKKDKEVKSKGKTLRSPEKFFEDQIKLEEAKQSVIERERLRYFDIKSGLLREKPEINKKSIDLAKRKTNRFNSFMKSNKQGKSKGKNVVNDIHCYLTKQKIGNFKKNKDIVYKNLHTSPINRKQIEEKEIKNLFDKLCNEKNMRQKNIRSLSNENEKPNKHSSIQTGDSSNLLILKDFLDRLFFALQETKFIEQNYKNLKNNLFINFEEFIIILRKAGFLKFDHNSVIENLNKKDMDNLIKDKTLLFERKQIEQELILLKDAWKILLSQNLEASNNLLDINIVIIFSIAILGIYKGDDRKENIRQVDANLKTNDLNINDKSNILLLNNINNNFNEFLAKNFNESTHIHITKNLNSNNKNNYYQHDHKKSFTMRFAKSNINNTENNAHKNLTKSKYTELLNLSLDNKANNISYSKNQRLKSGENFVENINKENAYLLSIIAEIKIFFPNFNYKNLVYNCNVTNQIRIIFREFYENWANKMFSNKKTKRSISVETKIKETNFSFKPKLEKSTILHATRFRNKILNNNTKLISSTIEKIENTNSNILTEKSNKIVSLEEIYQNIKIKKER